MNLSSIKKELTKLTDTEYLKKELTKRVNEVKKFDLHINLSPQAKSRLKSVEKNLQDIKNKVTKVQKQVDSEVHKLMKILHKTKKDAETKLKKVRSKKTTTKKRASKKVSRKKKA